MSVFKYYVPMYHLTCEIQLDDTDDETIISTCHGGDTFADLKLAVKIGWLILDNKCYCPSCKKGIDKTQIV